MRLVERLLYWIVGLVLAIPAGAVALFFGAVADAAARDLIGRLGLAAVDALFAAALAGGDPEAVAMAIALAFWTFSTILVVAPVTLVSAVGEIVGTRRIAFYGGLAGALTAAVPWLLRGGVGDGAALAAEGRLTALLFLTGAVAGCVYWTVAGRSAGAAAPPDTATS